MATRDQEGILRIISDGQRDGMHPHQIARELRGYFDGTEHNAVTAARTEAQKLRTDARVATYLKTGVHYLEYIAVDDGKAGPITWRGTARSTRSIRPPGSANRTAGAPSSTPTTASRKEVPAWKNLTASP